MIPRSVPPQTPARRAFTAFALVYILGGAAWLAYSFSADTGLSGWLMNWQMQHLGEADNRLTLVGNVVAWALSLVPIFYGLVRLNRAEGFTPTFPGQPLPAASEAAAGSATAARSYQQQQDGLYSRRGRTIAAAVFVAVGGAVFLYLTFTEARAAAQPVHQLDLGTSSALPAGTELAAVHGVLAANYGFVLEETKYSRPAGRTTYAPLLPPTWEPGQPVRFVVKTKLPFYQNPTTGRVFLLDSAQAFVATYDGQLSANNLPTYVSEHFAREHLPLAASYYVLDDEQVAGGHPVPANSNRWLALALGLVVAVSCFFVKQPLAATR